jgi:hypothetical protein
LLTISALEASNLAFSTSYLEVLRSRWSCSAVMRASATAWSRVACACFSAASFSCNCCWVLLGSKRTTGSPSFTALPAGACHTMRSEGTLTGAVICTERLAFSSPRQRTMTEKSPWRAGVVGRVPAACT